jgi:hypothetical protein
MAGVLPFGISRTPRSNVPEGGCRIGLSVTFRASFYQEYSQLSQKHGQTTAKPAGFIVVAPHIAHMPRSCLFFSALWSFPGLLLSLSVVLPAVTALPGFTGLYQMVNFLSFGGIDFLS